MSKFECDYYQLIKGSEQAKSQYTGEYMIGYDWAQQTKEFIVRIIENQ
jgi:hypothetical protein